MLTGFAPVFQKDARVLIVGTMPSVESLRAGQYYAHKRNAFWPIMARLFHEQEGQSYAARCQMLRAHRVALWDVVMQCEREGSLDAAIQHETPNDFDALFAQTGIRAVFANGKTAQRLFQKYVTLPDGVLFGGALFSTSPAYTLAFEKKLENWRAILPYLEEDE